METYPEDYVAHNLPYIALSGLPAADSSQNVAQSNTSPFQGGGLKISSNAPPLSGPVAEAILDEFLRADGASLAWSDQAISERSGLVGFKLQSTGRLFTFPPRKAAPPPLAPTISSPGSPTQSPPLSLELHSPLSPLSPSSPIFPDGLLTPLWLGKHQYQIPAVYLSFYSIGSDSSQDAYLKNEINDTRNALAKSGFRTRCAIVLVAEDATISGPELEDRLAAIRRATSLDPKTGCFVYHHGSSESDLPAFVVGVLKALMPICVDYYRDLTKHARRKRGRSSPPPLTAAPTRGSSQALTMNGWNVRYDFKLAAFAEFRQEMDVAQRHYESALEELFGPEGSLENTPSWSPRWEEARLLCDVIAFRVLRCQIWRGMTSGAAESWSNYKERMRDLVDRRGKGTDNSYSWEAWEARWAKMMAQLIEMADLPVFKPVDLSDSEDQPATLAVYSPAEKMYSTVERMLPFHLLHHPGYWWRIASKHIVARRRKAEAIPSEDRTPPSETPAAQVASRVRTYDTYLVPQPHEEAPLSGHSAYDYLLDLQSQTERVESIFTSRGQMRAVQQVKLDLAKEFVRAERYDEAVQTVQPVWDSMTWRRENWYELAAEVLEVLHTSAAKTSNHKLKLESAWELANRVLETQHPVDLMQCLNEAGESSEPIHVLLDSQSRLCPFSTTFSFLSGEGFVGDSASCQVAVTFNAPNAITPVALSELRIHFNNNIRSLVVNHSEATDFSLFTELDFQEEHDSAHPMAKGLLSSANLLFSPGQIRVFNLTIPLRDPDLFHATGASLVLKYKETTLEHVMSHPLDIRSPFWWFPSGEQLVKKQLCREEPNAIQVLPKPPKVQIRVLNLKGQYFTGEKISLKLELTNGEIEQIENATMNAKAQDDAESSPKVSWQRNTHEAEDAGRIGLEVGKMQPAESNTHVLTFPAPLEVSEYTLVIEVVYRLSSDPETPVSKILETTIPFVSPFEANYDFAPRLYTGKYPNFFSLPDPAAEDADGPEEAQGVVQKWCLASRIVSFSEEPLVIESTQVVVNRITSNSICVLEDPPKPKKLPRTVRSKELIDIPHILEVRKLALEDRRPSALDLSLAISWHRGDSNEDITTTLLVIPNMTIPTAEPRVLCTVDYTKNADSGAIVLSYMLENPSMHFLTFNLTMEASDTFAFSGSKHRSVSMTPMSRVQINYTIFAYDVEHELSLTEHEGQKGHWIWPVFRVVDAYFQKTLRVLDAGDGVQTDDRGGLGIWIPQKR